MHSCDVGNQEGSAKSTTLTVTLEEEATSGHNLDIAANHLRGQRSQPRAMAFSMPATTSHIKMVSEMHLCLIILPVKL